MKLIVLSVRDRAANCFGQPFYVASVGGAIRSFGDEVNRVARQGEPVNPLNVHPEDFDLFELGLFDDSVGKFLMVDEPRQIAIGKDFVK